MRKGTAGKSKKSSKNAIQRVTGRTGETEKREELLGWQIGPPVAPSNRASQKKIKKQKKATKEKEKKITVKENKGKEE